jgi:hypothetical protein
MLDFKELAISDGGPTVPVQVYQRLTGRVIWTQPDDMPYTKAVEQAKAICLNGLKPFNQK